MSATTQRGLGSDPLHGNAAETGLSLSAALCSVSREAHELLHDHLRLAALDAQRAVSNLVMMIGIGVAVALLAVTGWLALVATLVAVAVTAGAPWWLALLGACIVCIASAVAAAFWIRHLAEQLMFALTLRWLRPEPPPAPPAAVSPREASA